MDNSSRILGTDIDATSARVVFRSCEVDTFTYTVEADAATANLPELTQSVTLYRDGVKFFVGNVTDLQQSQDRVTVVVSGPWWYLDNAVLQTPRTDGTGSTADRPSFGFSGAMTTALTTVIQDAIDIGAPITIGTISTFFDIPLISLNQMTYGQAISELLRLIPDAMSWFDYSTTTPTLNITRRGVATTRTIDITDCTDFEVKPRLQLKLNYVGIPYADRATNGRRRWQLQSAGTPAMGFNGISVVSGPEMDTFLPDEPNDSFSINTQPTNGSAATIRAYLNGVDPVLSQLIQQYGSNWIGAPGAIPYYVSTHIELGGSPIQYHSSTPSGGSTPSQQTTLGARFTVNGQPISGTKYLVTSTNPIPDWAQSENGIAVYDAYLTCDIPVIVDYSEATSAGLGFPSSSLPGVVQFASFCWFREPQLYNLFGAAVYKRRGIFIYKADVPVKLMDSFVNGTIYRAPTFSYRAPPANFASNLLAAQNWVPYEGRLSMSLDESGGTRYRGCKVNVTSSRISAHATMGALVESEELDLLNDATTLVLGAPPRVDYQTWVDKARVTPQSNITYL